MKKILYVLAAAIICILILFKVEIKKIKPLPAETFFLENESDEIRREQWIEQIHKSAPGTNWRAIDLKTRIKKAEENTMPDYQKSSNIIIAGGDLVGYWRETGSMNLAGRTLCVEYDINEDSIYCASAGGNIWKASKTGIAWRCLNDNFKIPKINMVRKISNGNGYRLLVSSGEWNVPGFWYSDDDGQTWHSSTGLSGIENWGNVVKAVVVNDSQNTIYLLAFEWDYNAWEEITSLYVSTDKGVSFTKIQSYSTAVYGSKDNFDIWPSTNGTPAVYLIENNNIFYIDNNYSPVFISSIAFSTAGSVLLSGCQTATQTYLYVAVYGNDNTTFYQSADAGISWTQKGSIPTDPFMKNSFTVSLKYPDYLYYGGVECYVSQNGGSSWTKVNDWGEYYNNMIIKLHADIPGINSFIDSSDAEFIYVNTDGGTYISYDNLTNVENISTNNLNIGQYYSVYSYRNNMQFIFAGSQDQGYQFCNNNDNAGQESFTQIISGDYGHIVSADGGNSLWMVYPGYAAYYPAAITSPTLSFWWTFSCTGQFWIPPLMEDPTAPDKVYLGGGTTSLGTHIFHLTSTGSIVNANELSFDFSGSSNSEAISAMAYSPLNPDYRYVMNGNGDFFTSTDGGTTWTQTNGFDGPDGHYLYGAKIIPSQVQPGKVYVGGSGYSNPPVFVSTDNGASFTAINNGIPNTMVYDMAITPGDEYLFAATDVGPYVYITNNGQWYDLSQGFVPDQTYWAVDYLPLTNTVRFGTYGRGIWDFVIDSTTISVNNKVSENGLYVFPNPANQILNIESNNNCVSVYDLSGKLMIETRKNRIDVSGWSKGVYVVKTAGFSQKFVKN